MADEIKGTEISTGDDLNAKADPVDATSDDDDLFADASDEEEQTIPTPTPTPAETSKLPDIEKPIPRTSSEAKKETPETPPPTNTNKESLVQAPVVARTIPRTAPRPSNEAAKFGLPDGVSIPKSVHGKLLQGKLLDTLRGLPINLINDALTEYDDAVQIKGDSIRNHGAYLYGVVKRYVSVQERTKAGEEAGMGASLTPAVSIRLQRLIDDQFCSHEEMNDKVKMKIRMLSEKDALAAIDELSSVERRQIRNFGSYFMGILNRYMRGEKQMDHKKRQDSHDNHRGRRDAIDDHNDSFRRDRSRFDQGRHPPAMRSQQHHFVAQPPHGHQSYPPHRMGGMHGSPPPPPPPPPSQRPGNMNASFPRHQPQGMQMGPPQHQMNQPPGPPGQFVPQPAGLPPSMYGQSQVYNNNVVQPPLFSGGPQMGGASLPPPARNLEMYGNSNNNSRVLPFQGPPSQSFVNHQQPQNNRFSQPQRGGYQQQQPYQQTAPVVDILGIADKAASAVLALQNQRSFPPPMQQMQQQSMYSAPPVLRHQVALPPQSYPPAMASEQNYRPQQKKGRRTTATMQELPVQVQHAIQNLQVTGQINGPLDDGILGMVKDLPDMLALQALQKFSSIDKNTMRNKTAYLAGVLRRELEGINRR